MISDIANNMHIDFIFKTLRPLLDLSINDIKLSQMSADASVKQYYRVTVKDKIFILLTLPIASESAEEEFTLKQDRAISQSQSFIEAGIWLNEKMDHLPTIYGYNMAEGLVLLSDNGAKNLFDYLPTMSEPQIENYYKALVDWIIKLESSSFRELPQSLMRQFTDAALEIELMDFIDYGLCCGDANRNNQSLRKDLHHEFKQLVLQIEQLPKVLLHRDFQSKNILCNPSKGSFVVIDYQDMCIGPKYYDLASLIFDPYVSLSPDSTEKILRHYYESSHNDKSYQEFLHELSLVAVQRLLKAAGRFARLKYLHGKNTHMQFFNPAIKRVALLSSIGIINAILNFF